MRRICIGILAHVDAGKTTLSEALLYCSGALRRLGRVDHQDAFLDTETLERERGITIFSKQARMTWKDAEIQLMDTPGHVDFSAEMERTLQVLDAAILVISGSDGVQGHTRTLWRLLKHWGIPTFLFINKMDLPGADRSALLQELREKLDSACVDASGPEETLWEEAALCDETLLSAYLEQGRVQDEALRRLTSARRLFPCYFGSALKLEGVEALLDGLDRFGPRPAWPDAFGARVYKIGRDTQGNRLTYLKVTGGSLRVKAQLHTARPGEDPARSEKADQIRLYSGARFRTEEEVPAGTVCAVTGLTGTYPGQGLGADPGGGAPELAAVLSYRVELPEGVDPHTALEKLRVLEEEDPQLHLQWNERAQEIHVQLMGEVQLEVLGRLIRERFGLEVSFGEGSIVYRETLTQPAEGIGHFEPLRHYAEVHLLLEPGERGSGVQLASACPEDQLDRNWQRLILTHLAEREQPGVLLGAPLTDVKITLVAGRAHVKHTEGGDFRQATYRAVRQGLMQAQCRLLEPWYDFRLELPPECVGRALSDLSRMGGRTEPPETGPEETVVRGAAPVSELRSYAAEVRAYTRGRGRMICTLRGYELCHNEEEVLARAGYDPERDPDNPPGSVFCEHGAGVQVPWDQVPARAHVSSGLRLGKAEPEEPAPVPPPRRPEPRERGGSLEEDAQLRQIFERTYGPITRRGFTPRREAAPQEASPPKPAGPQGKDYLLVDGYNMIFAWDELKSAARENLDAARKRLMDLLSNYQGVRGCELILVFDAYKMPNQERSVFRYHNIYVVYTKEAETADAYIEKTTYEIGPRHRVRVATSDGAEQLIILGHGALRISAAAFREEVLAVQEQITQTLRRNNRQGRSQAVRRAMERAQQKERPEEPPEETRQP